MSNYLKKFPQDHLTSQQPWDPHNACLPGIYQSEQEEIESRYISTVGRTISNLSLCASDCCDSEDKSEIFNPIKFNDRSINSVKVQTDDADQIRSDYIFSMNSIQSGELDYQGPLKDSEHCPPVIFISKERHSETTPDFLSDR